jgi:hypothetical protein
MSRIRTIGLLVAAVTAVTAFLGLGVAYATPTWPGPERLVSHFSGGCIEPSGLSVQAGAVLVVADCSGASPYWTASHVEFNDHRSGSCNCTVAGYEYRNLSSNLCMALADDSGIDGTLIVQQPCATIDYKQIWNDDYSSLPWSSTYDQYPVVRVSRAISDGVGRCLARRSDAVLVAQPCNHGTSPQAWYEIQ